jgi:tetratricopeptide (TPR) repeat protein
MKDPGESLRHRWFAAAFLVATVFLAYANSVRAPFLFDDTAAVENNPTIRRLWSLDVVRPPADGGTTTGRPVVNLSYALNYAVSGERVWSYHLVNIALHAGAALLLLGIIGAVATSPQRPLSWVSPSIAFFIALLWALHPLQTETVVSAAQRTELLCGFFYLLTLYAFIRGVPHHGASRSGRAWFVISVVSGLLGMGTKEVMVTAPLIVLLYDRTFIAGTFAGAGRARWKYYAALAATWLFVPTGSRGASAGFGLGVSSWNYLLQQCEALVLYLRLALWPHPLVLDYGTQVARSIADVWWQGGVVLALLAATVWALVRRPVLGYAGACFFLVLAPSSSVVPLVTQTMAEHRMYLPLAVAVTLVAFAVARMGATARWILALAALVFGGITVARNADYRDAVTIWSDNVMKRPDVARGHLNLAWALQITGRPAEANRHYARAVELEPNYVSAHYNWGASLLEQGRMEEALFHLQTAVRLAPEHAAAHLNLGTALMRGDRVAEAITHFEAALRLNPGADAHYDLGVALDAVGQPAAAAEHFRAAESLPEAAYQLGRLAEHAGNAAEAETHYARAIRLDPNHAAAHARLGLLFARSERLTRAVDELRTAVRLRPGDANGHANLGNVLLLQGDVAAAIASYESALRLRPDDPRLRESLDLARQAQRAKALH